MQMEEYIAALTIGFIGSIHCIGMCGPIALALPLPQVSVLHRFAGSFIYNFGRVITYGILGILFGAFGQSLAMAGIQQIVSIILGCVMILSVIFPFIFRKLDLLGIISQKSTGWLSSKLGPLFRYQSLWALFLIGILNGLLPCGLVYVAIAGAINTGSIINGAFFMGLFGIGTFATMLFIPVAKSLLSVNIRRSLSRIIPVFIIILGVIFILRGMNLGIKYISPKINKTEAKVEKCCH